MTDSDSKAAMRRDFRQRRDDFFAKLSEPDRRLSFSALPSPLAALLRPGMVVAGYVAAKAEADPARLLAQIADRGCSLALPHIVSRAQPMRFLSWTHGDPLVPGPFGLLQPADDARVVNPDLVIAPLVAFDGALMRLGQGGGHYDRALSQLPGAIVIGLAWAVQQAPNIAADPWDVPMDAVLTEKSWMTS